MKHNPTPRSNALRGAFTLVELLVVIAIIAILASLAFSAYQRVQDSSKKVQCASNLRQIGQGFQNYVVEHENTYPNVYDGGAANGDVFWYNTVAKALGLDSGAAWQEKGLWHCPACKRVPSYTMSWCVVEYGFPLRTTQLSRPMNTVLAADGPGYEGAGINTSPPFGGADPLRHKNGANYLFADSHVEFLSEAPKSALRPQDVQ